MTSRFFENSPLDRNNSSLACFIFKAEEWFLYSAIILRTIILFMKRNSILLKNYSEKFDQALRKLNSNIDINTKYYNSNNSKYILIKI